MSKLIDKSQTALVVIDLQKGIVAKPAAPYESATVVKHASAIAAAFRKESMPVFLVNVTPSPDGKNALRPLADVQLPAQKPPADWAELVPEMNAAESDIRITKRQWGAFYGTGLELELRRRGISTIVLCGISTNIGVESTARFAYEFGFHQIFVEDAMAAFSAEEHHFPVAKIFPRLGQVRKTKDVLDDLVS